jgi:pyrroloquinoline quinone biosynthesis protein B
MARAILLGTAQDAGLPQAGCGCANCRAAWADPARRRRAVALGLVDDEGGAFLIDATPDFRDQLHALTTAGAALSGKPVTAEGVALRGILLTHAHMGHYAGLLHLGFEAMAARGVPLFGTRRLLDFLAGNAPWRQLFDQGNLHPVTVAPGEPLALGPGVSASAHRVPHRAEWSDTVAYVVQGPHRRLLYLPDIDSWADWAAPPFGQDMRAAVAAVDVALLDGTFFSPAELPGRDQAAIAHPLPADTAARLAGLEREVRLIHLNHTNPLHHPGPERDWLAARGIGVGDEGQVWAL